MFMFAKKLFAKRVVHNNIFYFITISVKRVRVRLWVGGLVSAQKLQLVCRNNCNDFILFPASRNQVFRTRVFFKISTPEGQAEI